MQWVFVDTIQFNIFATYMTREDCYRLWFVDDNNVDEDGNDGVMRSVAG